MDKKYTNIKERVLEYAKYQGVSIEKFLHEIDMTYGSFKGKAKEGALNSNAIEKIYTIYPNLNLDWLITGEGEMEKININQSDTQNEPNNKLNDLSEILRLQQEMTNIVKISQLQLTTAQSQLTESQNQISELIKLLSEK